MSLYKSILTIVIVSFSIAGVYNQVTDKTNNPAISLDNFLGCTPFNDKAKSTVEFFLGLDDDEMEGFRVTSGTSGIPLSEIQHVNSSIECSQLDALVAGNNDYQHEETNFTRYYYKTNDFFYVFYRSNELRLGYTKFIVVGSDYTVKGLYMI